MKSSPKPGEKPHKSQKTTRSLRPSRKGDQFWYSIFRHPVSRLLKFECFLQNLRELPKDESNHVVLDYGSGDRPYEELLLTRFGEYISADYEQANKSHTKQPDVFIDESSIQIEDESVDCVILTEVLEHIYQPKQVLGEIHRVLRPGGHLLGTVPFAIYEHEAPYDYHRYTYYCLDRMFREAGFEVVKLEYVGDLLGVFVISLVQILLFAASLTRRVLGNRIAGLLSSVLRIPEYLYYLLHKSPLKLQRLHYFKKYPVGFAFKIRKPTSGTTEPTE